jgi:2-methylcitrate dehydratase PrpD
VPIVLTTGRAGLEEFSDAAVAQADVQALGRKVCFTEDASLSIDAARVIITQAGGQTLMAAIDCARGSLHKPLTDSEIENKLRALCRYGRSGCEPEPLIDAVWGLDGVADVGVVMDLARGAAR